jgi:hypothetical protein
MHILEKLINEVKVVLICCQNKLISSARRLCFHRLCMCGCVGGSVCWQDNFKNIKCINTKIYGTNGHCPCKDKLIPILVKFG